MNIKKIGSRILGNNFLLVVTIVLFVLMYIAGCIIYGGQNFTRSQVFMNFFIDNAGLIVAAMGMTMVLITGGIDISVGSMVALTCMMLAYMMERMQISSGVAIVAVLLFGILFGTVQGFFIAYLKIQPFIVTLAGMFFCRGLTSVISSDMIAIKNETFLGLAMYKINVPLPGYVNRAGDVIQPYIYPSVIIALLAMAVVFVVLRYTKFGRTIFAVGGNEQSALLMGLNVRAIKLRVYMINGFLASMAGFVYCLNTTSGFTMQARGFEMEAIASAVIGGTLLTGGAGNPIGTLFGVLIRGVIEKFISFNGTLNSGFTSTIIGILLAFFIILQSIISAARIKRQ
jgi:simple sugar transport system permease protein